jgi:hypothetical protein
MKPGDYYIDNYYEPETIVLKVTDLMDADGYECTVVYSSDPDRMGMNYIATRYSDDEDLIPVAMITIDDKLMIIKL